MDIHEHQAKDILATIRRAGAEGRPRLLAGTGRLRGAQLGFPCVVKAQIHSGGRGEAGGVKVCKSEAEGARLRRRPSGQTLVTKQTGASGKVVHRLWVEEATDIAQEIYLGFVLDRKSERIMIVASGHGGMEIEDLAARGPRQPRADGHRPRHRARGVPGARARVPPRASGKQIGQMVTTLRACYRAYRDLDAMMVEINPLAITGGGDLVALDAKMSFDTNALFRRPQVAALRDPARRTRARRWPPITGSPMWASTATSAASSTARASPWPRWT
jgi:malate-CoA ligase subunit beta